MRGGGSSFRSVSTGDLNLVEDMPALFCAVIGEVNVKFSFGLSWLVLIGGFLRISVMYFINRRLQLEDGVCAVLPGQGGLEILVRLQSRRQCDCFNRGCYQSGLLPLRLAINVEIVGELMGQVNDWDIERGLWRDRVERLRFVRILFELVML